MAESAKSLNKDQQKLVEDNYKLIYSYAYKTNLDIYEYYDILAIGLCHAALEYDPSKGKFSTYAYAAMCNEVYNHWRNTYKLKRAIPQDMLVSYNEILNEKIETLDIISYQAQKDILRESYGLDISHLFIEENIKKLNDKERFIVLRSALGYKQKEIAKELGISQSYISRILRNIEKKWKGNNDG